MYLREMNKMNSYAGRRLLMGGFGTHFQPKSGTFTHKLLSAAT